MAGDEVAAVIEDVGVEEKTGVGIEDEVGVGVEAVIEDAGVVVEEEAVVEIEDQVEVEGGVVVGVGVEDFVGGLVLKWDEVAIEDGAVAGVVDQLLVEVALEAEIGTLEEVETLVDSLYQMEALFCFLWVEAVKGVMQRELHL